MGSTDVTDRATGVGLGLLCTAVHVGVRRVTVVLWEGCVAYGDRLR